MKNQKGITLLTLSITIAIMIILTFTITVNIEPYKNQKIKINFETDMQRLREEISQYYARVKDIPIINKFTNTTMLEGIKNINDNDEYYVIDIKQLEVELNNGSDYYKIEQKDVSEEITDLLDVYIINKQSHTIYYPKGVEYNGNVYYRLPEVYSEINGIYTVTFSGTNVTNAGANTAKPKETYTTNLVFTNGYGVVDIVVKMDGETLVENTNFTYSNDILSVPNVNGNLEISVTTLPTVESKRTSELIYFSNETPLVDNNRNIMKVPKGFKIAEDSGINVTEGIIIEDNDIIEGIGNNRGNQYVWIPVGTGIKKTDGTTVDITLGRYIFADGTNHKDEEGTVLAKGTPILMQNAESYSSEKEIRITDINPTSISGYGYKELATSRTGGVDQSKNTTALNLKGFIDSVKSNGGYYIARYEASYGEDGKANSKVSNSYYSEEPTTEGTLWNNITQIDAAIASRGLYTTATTDLINSYAWDTAIVYIQKFSGDEDYSYQDGYSINSSLSNTGNLAENVKDEVCKINDMAANTSEWSTEYYNYVGGDDSIFYPCTDRGGGYWTEYFTGYASVACERNTSMNGTTFAKNDGTCFRFMLHL